MASRADLAAHRRKRNPQGCVALSLPIGEAKHPFLQRHQGRKRKKEISIELPYFLTASICCVDMEYGGMHVRISVLCQNRAKNNQRGKILLVLMRVWEPSDQDTHRSSCLNKYLELSDGLCVCATGFTLMLSRKGLEPLVTKLATWLAGMASVIAEIRCGQEH